MDSLAAYIGRLGHPDANPLARWIYTLYQIGFKIAYRVSHRQDRINVYERDWDVLIILDACRIDLMREVFQEYPSLEWADPIHSVGSSSGEWMEKTFTNEYADEVQKTAYVTGNIKTNKFLDPNKFYELDEVWKYAWDEDRGTIPPRPITDRAIATWKYQEPDRMIVHYMQPHFPSLSHPELGSRQVPDLSGGRWETVSIWDDLRSEKYDRDTVWEAYRENLQAVLNDVKLLTKSISASNVVLTSDHGNAFGEWGFYDHPGYHPLPELRKVPWIRTTAEDTSGYEPNTPYEPKMIDDQTVQSRLRQLGYLD
jgi:hypothetical protein